MTLLYRRHLPHWIPDNTIIFITWRLAGCLLRGESDGMHGPAWLRDPQIADMILETLDYGARVRKLYSLHAWTVMPNHVHVVFEPHIALPEIMRWLKGRTSRVANRILGRSGKRFWQDESYDHWIRSSQELAHVISYVERNPVRAGLAASDKEWRWSSAWKAEADDERRSSAPRQIICPTYNKHH